VRAVDQAAEADDDGDPHVLPSVVGGEPDEVRGNELALIGQLGVADRGGWRGRVWRRRDETEQDLLGELQLRLRSLLVLLHTAHAPVVDQVEVELYGGAPQHVHQWRQRSRLASSARWARSPIDDLAGQEVWDLGGIGGADER
jgi:hypothetical protein